MYDKLFKAWKKEKENIELQPLTKGFYKDLAGYIKKIRREKRMLDDKSIKGRLIHKEEENIRAMIEELVQVRHEKVMQDIANGRGIPITALTKEEKSLYRELTYHVDSLQIFSNSLLQGKIDKGEKQKPTGLMVVRILQEIPEIIGTDKKLYGPFKPEDITLIPQENARNLIKQGAVMEIETK